MAVFFEGIKAFFSSPPRVQSAFQFNAGYLSGLQMDSKSRDIKNYFILSLEPGMIEESFAGRNIPDVEALRKKLSVELRKMNKTENRTAVLLPELCQKSFIFQFDGLPKSYQEKVEVVRFRIKKQMPMLPEDAHLSFDIMDGEKPRVLAVVARRAVIKEYQDLFSGEGFRVGMVGVPIISLAGLIDRKREKDFLLVSIEEGSFSLLASVRSEVVLCRQKASIRSRPLEAEDRIEGIIQDIENTVNFIEDHESRRIEEVWIRTGLIRNKKEILAGLGGRLAFPIRRIEGQLKVRLSDEEKDLLSPALGQLL
jgi:hypothetical protein